MGSTGSSVWCGPASIGPAGIECSAEVSGKPQGSDRRNGRTTVPDVLGVPATGERLRELRDEALAALAAIGDPAQGLRWICDDLLAGPASASAPAPDR